MLTKKKILEAIEILSKMYPEAKCELNYKTPFELLIATMLSAQSTDKRVNIVTEELFKKYNTPEKFLELTISEIENKIKTCGLYKSKAKAIYETSKVLAYEYDSIVPNSIEELQKLRGVGRKTANVVVSNAFNVPAIAVDTHVFRVSKRIGLAKGDNVVKVEEELMKNIKKSLWSDSHHYIIWHGRRLCKARNPECHHCDLNILCEYYKNQLSKKSK